MPRHDARAEEEKEEGHVTPSVDLVVEHVAETGSTNDDLLARVHAAAQAGAASFSPQILAAERQTAGRGRLGRRWHGAAGASLTFSVAWPCARADLGGLSLAVGSALADALEPPRGDRPPRIGLTWPTDLWLLADGIVAGRGRGRKLAGVLIETAPLAALRVAVVGVGINIGAQAIVDAASGFASLDEIDSAATGTATLARVAPALVHALRRFDDEGFAPFAASFAARDLMRGRRIAGADGSRELEGIARGVAGDGTLRLETATGIVAVTSGEWRLTRIEPAGAPC
jgi:BirA family biotin operon repressor/biotin-[acetyl-CoA-carboxylase] ligase